jgi:PhzF family phenazine biosynthesis protein
VAEVQLSWVDAFGDGPFTGNPAAVCLLQSEAPAVWMQALAAEFGISETAFVRPHGDGYSLRWFTPRTEVDLCGHATLASAHALGEAGLAPEGRTIRFHTRSGVLGATRSGERIELELPIDPVSPAGFPVLEAALAPLDVVATGCSHLYVIAELGSAAAVRAARPDLAALRTLPGNALVVTAPAEERGVDYVLRCFGPKVGIDEDPVTGSAQCALGPYWAERTGHRSLVAVQASARGGRLWVEVGEGTVSVGGRATTVLRGTVTAPEGVR